MKKTALFIIGTALFLMPLCAKETKDSKDKNQNTKTEEKAENGSSQNWDSVKEQGKKALSETGVFFKGVGNEISSSVKESMNNLTEVKCYGTWVYKTKNCTTTFEFNEDGTMEVSRKVGKDTDYWKGTFSVTIRAISFTITESGRKGVFASTTGTENLQQKWYLSYFTQDDENQIRITCEALGTDIDGTDFAKGIVFTKK